MRNYSALPTKMCKLAPRPQIQARHVHQSYTPYNGDGYKAHCTFLHFFSGEENLVYPCWGKVAPSTRKFEDGHIFIETTSFPASRAAEPAFRCEGHYTEVYQCNSLEPIPYGDREYYIESYYTEDELNHLKEISIESWFELHNWMKGKIILL
ncbi:MAG: hypothetical protein GY861_22230 [bacterium]|nr:hypothetical protein [bacterium]